jgi:polar amino acid transport system substrate-binding protein
MGLVTAAVPPAHAEGVLERVARSGQLRLVGPVDQPPLMQLDGSGVPRGYSVVVAQRVADLLTQAVGRPVTLRFQPATSGAQLDQQLTSGAADLACGLPFSWARDEILDLSIPIGLSGLRLMAPAGRFSGDLAALAGRPIGVVGGSLAETDLRGTQPAARAVTFASLSAAVRALGAGQVDGVIGDSLLLRGQAQQQGLTGMALTPQVPFERYALVCAMPENASAFRNLVNRAIAQLQQGYLDGETSAVTLVNRWLGPGSAVDLPPATIRNLFDALLTGVEPFRPAAPAAAR